MPRKRKDSTTGLPPRVYLKHGAFYYVHPDGKWERIGKSIEEARRIGRLYAENNNGYGTVAYWLDRFLSDRAVKPRRLRRGYKARTTK